MTLVNVAAATRRGQVLAESLMTERIIIDRPETSTDVDDDGRPVITGPVIYDGIGKIRTFRPYEQSPDVAGAADVTVQRTDWHIPADSRMEALIDSGRVTTWQGPVQAGDRARRVTDGKPVKTVRIAGEHEMTHQTAQRLAVDDITSVSWAPDAPPVVTP